MKKRHDKIVKRLHDASERCLQKAYAKGIDLRDAGAAHGRAGALVWHRRARAYSAAARLIQHAWRAKDHPDESMDALIATVHHGVAKREGF